MQLPEQLLAVGVKSFPCWARYNEQRGRWDKGPAVPKGVSWQTIDQTDPALDWSTGVIGVPIPEGVVVLDLDTYKGVTREAVEQHLGCALPWDAALIQKTIGGGEHYAYRCSWDVRQGDSIGVDGLDTRAAGKGFICSGAGYSPLGFGVFALAHPEALPELPEGARQALERVPDPAPATARQEPAAAGRDEAQIVQALQHIDPGCSRSDWRNVGFALKALYADDDAAGYWMFERWSAGEFWPGDAPDNYVTDGKGSALDQWGTFKAEGAVRPATLFYKAIESGWIPPATFNTASAFGPGAVPADAFQRLATRVMESGGDIMQTAVILDEIRASGCNGLQTALLAAELKNALKDAGINDSHVRKSIDQLLNAHKAPPVQQGETPAAGQVLDADTPLHPSAWAPFQTKGTAGTPKGTIRNLEIMLDAYGVSIEFDEIGKTLRIEGPSVPGAGVLHEEAALAYLDSLANLNEYPTASVRGMIMPIANRHTINPVEQWVQQAPWDGLDHIGLLWQQIQLEPGEDAGFCELMFRKWMRGAYAIGTGKTDRWEHAIVLVDPNGGAGKTRFFSTFCPPELRKTDVILDVSNKDSVKTATSYWIVELGELDGTFNRSDSNKLKAFLSMDVDEMRLPYGRAYLKYPRRTAYVGSVNEPKFLIDQSDNRRFWGMRVIGANHKHTVNVQQAWAQAAAELAGGLAAHMTDAEKQTLCMRNEAFRSGSPVADALGAMQLQPGTIDDHQTVSQILSKAGLSRPSKADLNEASRWLRRQGLHEVRKQGRPGHCVTAEPVTAGAFKPTVIDGGKR